METLYIGTNFGALMLKAKDFSFAAAPHVVLYSKSNHLFYVADEVSFDEQAGTATALFSANVTKTMLAGVYDLEVYEDASRVNLFKHIDDYCRAIYTAASPQSVQS